MLNINKETDGNNMTISLSGRLDTTTAPDLESKLKEFLDGVISLSIDCKKLEYISSAGLRILLFAHKFMSKQGKMVIRNVSKDIKEIFDITGFSDILTIE